MSVSWSPIQFFRTAGCAPIVIVCEHASANIPEDFADLGLSDETRNSHAVWDIGALKMAQAIATELDAPLISSDVSRAIYDCNRPFLAPDCIPTKSELIEIPGNGNLSGHQKNTRRRLIHDLFHGAVKHLIANQIERTDRSVAVITVHTFIPIYFGRERDVEIGFLHHGNAALSEAAKQVEDRKGQYKVALNQPYGKEDGVTYSICRHADANRLHSTMIEVSNGLVRSDPEAEAMGQHLAGTLKQALDNIAKQSTT